MKTYIISAFILGAVTSTAQAEPTQYPLTIENCGQEITFENAPDRVVSIGQGGTELLYSLGLADVVKGTALWRSDVWEQFADVNAGIERLGDNEPSFESIVAKRPQLVIADLINSIGPNGRIGTPEQFADLGGVFGECAGPLWLVLVKNTQGRHGRILMVSSSHSNRNSKASTWRRQSAMVLPQV